MKFLKLPFVGLCTLLLAASCNKNDVQQQDPEQPQMEMQAGSFEKIISSSDWQALGWKSKKTEGSAYFTTVLKDDRLNGDVLSEGLLLVYKKNSVSVETLPFDENSATFSYNWYYQASEGSLQISSASSASAPEPSSANSFRYFIISPDQLRQLETEGHSRVELMNLTYNNAVTVLSKLK
ncbi:MAG TPA: hypothetical protein VHK69_00985 [Chitinophagaceae bacterium]|jgi:hypothetical protein|nr:hypothetical protein [Chitinophagaceae bacterium]